MSSNILPTPPPESIIYEDEWLYICLAMYPFTKGHVIVIWKKPASDLHLLSDHEYDYLMGIIDIMRDAMLKVLAVKKVYLIYMDEVRQVHWHLVPRYNKFGYTIFTNTPRKTHNFTLVSKLRAAFWIRCKTRDVNLPDPK